MHTGFADDVVYERDVINDVAQRPNRFAKHLPDLAMLLELEHGLQPRAEAILKSLDVLAEIRRLAMLFDELRLEVEQINVAGRPGHEELDDALSFWFVVFGAVTKHRGEGDPAEATAGVK
jgi:hypothetical protein